MILRRKTVALALFLALGTLTVVMESCHKDHNNTTTTMTLYDTLGGTAKVSDPATSGATIEKGRLAIRSVVDSAIFVIAADDSINGYFKVLLSEVSSGNLSGFQELSKNLTDFFCVATGAKDFTYGGLSMHDAHDPTKNPRITNTVDSADFGEFVNDVVKGANKNSVPTAIIGRLGTIIFSVEGTVVQR